MCEPGDRQLPDPLEPPPSLAQTSAAQAPDEQAPGHTEKGEGAEPGRPCGPDEQASEAAPAPAQQDTASGAASADLPSPEGEPAAPWGEPATPPGDASGPAGEPVKVAVVSFLFNWPSTGGGIVHTVELARFLARAGYRVRHFHARYAPWGIGAVAGQLPFDSEALEFQESDWNLPAIKDRFRRAVAAFGPDYAILTDSWNIKPHLAEALRGQRVLLRLQALECLCPLNNVRLLAGAQGQPRQCPVDQFSSSADCARCLRENGHQSGGLHQAERALSGAGTPEYHRTLLRAFREAEAVLVVDPQVERLVAPHARLVRVVTAGMDPARFPWPWPGEPARAPDRPLVVLFAGLVQEWMKGFHVLHQACALLWQRRQDFELWATTDPVGPVDEFTRWVGWHTQEDLPGRLRGADVVVLPTIAQEALGRTAVEAMGVGRPVIASRLGGLPSTVIEGVTGLLFEPGDARDLAGKIETLLDDPARRERLGLAGRRLFDRLYTWDSIIERHYRPLLARPRARGLPAAPTAYTPFIPDRVDQARLRDDVGAFFDLAPARVEALYQSYRGVHQARDYERSLGELKTLCFEEAFVLYVLLSRARPATIVEVGTQHGKSTRRLLDIKDLLGLDARVVCFDLVDQVRHFRPDEAELILRDLSDRFRQDVLDCYEPGLLFLDVHAHALLWEVLRETLAHPGRWLLALHDCGRGLCNPHMSISREDPNVTSLTGVWERHVLAEVFGVADPLSPALDALESDSHRLRIFDTPHGLAVILPR